ncbi:MAG: binding-protein-dependent transport system inner rane component, partial [Bacillota bacterium]|nr:binding-protein-dependent transport system inner rane component [Bacillota bacterium]
MKSSKKVSVLFVLPFIVFYGLFWLVPFFFGFYMSLHKYSLINGNQGFVGLSNYFKILFSDSMHNASFFLGVKNTLIFVVISTPPLVLFSLGLALLIDHLPHKVKALF